MVVCLVWTRICSECWCARWSRIVKSGSFVDRMAATGSLIYLCGLGILARMLMMWYSSVADPAGHISAYCRSITAGQKPASIEEI